MYWPSVFIWIKKPTFFFSSFHSYFPTRPLPKNKLLPRFILSSIFNNPIATNSIDAILTCFAPIAYEEINRICKKDGYFILVRPNVKHLYELKEVVYTNPYDNELEEIKLNNFEIINEYSISNHSILDKQDILNLFKMTPYYHKTSMNDMNKLLEVNQLDITFDFIISIYKKS